MGRKPRNVYAIAYRCPCGKPAVVETQPRLEDGTPFQLSITPLVPGLPVISTLESTGLMTEMNLRLATDTDLADAYAAAHDDYLIVRSAPGIDVPEIDGISAGGMPDRVKCLHSLVAHSLAAGPGVNPLW